jgi:glycine/D-amino acid oxidase-like deaminating enzyme
MKTLYDPAMYDATRPVPSYWEADTAVTRSPYTPLVGEQSCEVAVIGAGYTGLSTALHLARDHGIGARVLDAGHVGWGASGRNGGFCTLAATKLGVSAMIRRFGMDETRRFYAAQVAGVHLVRRLAEEEGIAMEIRGDASLTVAHRAGRYADLGREADLLPRLCDVDTRLYSADEFAEHGYRAPEQHGALAVSPGFALHPLKFVAGLAASAHRRGALVHPLSPVLSWQRRDGRHVLATPGGRLRAERVVIASNGFTPEGLHPALDGAVLPVISNIVTTRPLTRSELDAHAWRTENPICNTFHLFNYYRMLDDGRLLLGARGDTSGSPAAGTVMGERLQRQLARLFPAWRSVPISHCWRGFICVTRRLTPYVGRVEDEPSVWYGFGYHGNGVNTAPWVGRVLAERIAGRDPLGEDIPAVMAGPPARFPLPGWRLWALRGAILYYRFRDVIF